MPTLSTSGELAGWNWRSFLNPKHGCKGDIGQISSNNHTTISGGASAQIIDRKSDDGFMGFIILNALLTLPTSLGQSDGGRRHNKKAAPNVLPKPSNTKNKACLDTFFPSPWIEQSNTSLPPLLKIGLKTAVCVTCRCLMKQHSYFKKHENVHFILFTI